MTTISERIKQALEIREMKQADLIRKTGINKGALSSYISGKYEPKQNNIYLMARALNVSEAWLMGKDVPMKRPDSLYDICFDIADDKEKELIIEEYKELTQHSIESEIEEEKKEKAKKLLALYEKADPKIQAAVDALLKTTE